MRFTQRARLLSLVLCLWAASVRPQSILSIGGGGTDDGRAATAADLNRPLSIAFAANGDLFIADWDNNRIRKVSAATGIITTVAGNGSSGFTGDGGPATEASLSDPSGVALDASGNIYIADAANARVRRVDAKSGVISTFAGSGRSESTGDGGPATAAGMYAPMSVAVSPAGDVYVLDSQGNRIRKVAGTTGIISTFAGTGAYGYSGDGGPATAATFRLQGDTSTAVAYGHPPGIAFDAAGALYITDTYNHRVRRVDAGGTVTTIAGNGTNSYAGDGGPATAAALNSPTGIVVDGTGSIYVADTKNERVRKIAGGTITTYAGTGGTGFSGDGGPASAARFLAPMGLAFNQAGDLFIVDKFNDRIRRIVIATSIISTYAGSGVRFSGDGGFATAGLILAPVALTLDTSGNAVISEYEAHRVRKLTTDGKITTIAGVGKLGTGPDGQPATSSLIEYPAGVAIDASGAVYFAETSMNKIRRIAANGLLSTFAGTGTAAFSGDGGPAVSAALNLSSDDPRYFGISGYPSGVVIDSSGDMYVADTFNYRIRRIAASTGVITTIAGSGTLGFGGDGGPATAAQFARPTGLALDRNVLYVADTDNHRIRRIDLLSGTASTIAGSGPTGRTGGGYGGDGGAATSALLFYPTGVAVDAGGNILIADCGNQRIRKITSGTITTVAGNGALDSGFTGDGGAALAAGLSGPQGVSVDKKNTIWIADTEASRVRVMYACSSVTAPALTAPANGAALTSTGPTLTWNRVDGAFRYDVYLGTTNPPSLLTTDVTATAYTPSNLAGGATFYWKIVAKGDPFCSPTSSASSEIRAFGTPGGCQAAAAVNLLQPAEGATGVTASAQLSWQASSGTSSYDVYFGPSNPPPLYAGGITATSQSVVGLTANTTYSWFVTARASCDASKLRSSAVRTFTTAGACTGAGSFALSSPSSGASGVSTSATLQWTASANAASYDVYLGSTNPPPVYLTDVQRNQIGLSGLAPSRVYYWRVIAKVPCDSTRNVASSVSSFTTGAACAAPPAPSITFVPPGNVGVGQTYTIAWKELAELDEASFYVVERSTSQTFSSVLDSQQTFSTAASFVANSAGTYFHRVRGVASCDPAHPGSNSEAKAVTVVTGTANVVFTVQPQAVVTGLKERIEEKKSTFTLENLGASSLQVIVGKSEINSVPFFTISDPLGGDSVFITLAPRTPKTLEIRYSGPANDQAGSYQGIVFVAATGQGLAITPYAFVNLKIGGGTTSRPAFLSNGSPTEYVFFPGFSGDDAARPSISVDISNNGSSPMELAAEIGPELWLVPQSGWNSSPIAAGTSRTIQLKTQRSRAPNGSALPRYTYFTVRSKSGETARLLVQDNDALTTAAGRSSLLDPGSRSYVVPGAVSRTWNGAPSYTRLRLSNIGSEPVQAELFFTAAGIDGFDSGNVQRATIVVPPNDVVTLTDPLVEVFGLNRPTEGQIEVRAAQDRVGFLLVSAAVVTAGSSGGFQTYQLPVLRLAEGARAGSNHTIAGVTTSSSLRTSLILTETSGTDASTVRAAFHDGQGAKVGEQTVTVKRYGHTSIDLSAMSASVNGGRVEISVQSGGGSVAGIATMLDASLNSGAVVVSQPASGAMPSSLSRIRGRILASSVASAVAPVVINGAAPDGSAANYRTSMGFTTSGAAGAATVTYRPNDPSKPAVEKSVQLVPNIVLQFDNVLEQLFGIASGASARGSVYIGAAAGAQVYARLLSSISGGPWKQSSSLPIFASVSDVMTSLSSRKPLYLDGLEQSVDSTRGSRWALVLNETGGNSGSVSVRLYEAGNRSAPIAEKTVAIKAWEQQRLDTVFASLGLDQADRRKDRTNVLCVVTPESGNAVISAVGVAVDNATGDTNHYVFSPSGGVPATGVVRLSIVTPIAPTVPSTTTPGRRRAVGK